MRNVPHLVNEPINSFLVLLVDRGGFNELRLHVIDVFGLAENVADWKSLK